MGGGTIFWEARCVTETGSWGILEGGEVVLGIKGVINPAPPPPMSVREGKNKLF